MAKVYCCSRCNSLHVFIATGKLRTDIVAKCDDCGHTLFTDEYYKRTKEQYPELTWQQKISDYYIYF